MQPLDKTAWEVLNATADNCENLEQIYRQVCYELVPDAEAPGYHPYSYRPVQEPLLLSQIADVIRRLVEQGLLTIVMDEEGHPWQDSKDLSFVWRAWFSMTPEGRMAWESSEHMVEQE